MDKAAGPPKWLRRLIQSVGALVLLDGAARLTGLAQAHICGLNRFLLRDGMLVLVAFGWTGAGLGTVFLKNWGRALMVLCFGGQTAYVAFNFFLVLRVPNAKVDALGWILMALMVGFCVSLILLFWRGWNRLFQTGVLAASRKWMIVGAVCFAAGIVATLLEDVDPGGDVAVRSDLDARFLLEAKQWPIYRARVGGTASKQSAGQLAVREIEGRITISEFPPLSRCEAVFDPVTGTLAIQGTQFGGEPFEGAPLLVGRRKLRGLRFKRKEGAIRGDASLAMDEEGNLFIFVTSITVHGKNYEAIYVSPRREALGLSEPK